MSHVHGCQAVEERSNATYLTPLAMLADFKWHRQQFTTAGEIAGCELCMLLQNHRRTDDVEVPHHPRDQARITSLSSLAGGRTRRGRPGRSRSNVVAVGTGRSVRTSSMKTGPPHRAHRSAPRVTGIFTPSAGRNVPFFSDWPSALTISPDTNPQ